MTIKIACVGNIKEDYLKKAIADYSKRIQQFFKLEIIELKEEPEPKNLSQGAIDKIKDKEYKRFVEKIDFSSSYTIGLFIDGKQYESVEFAHKLDKWIGSSKVNLVFVIGGSNGLDDRFYQLCDEKISFSKMTFPHQLMRVILLEQIYRGFKILNNQKYHK
ncbi:23S rRNA (pseudouridine(1915)-N(3))-methyltransferase RlmH [Ureaplasma ceti]|uniref:Ribosomal RNA large subunit methyltransferase H n=1 Tax=Ureaplasma ceti TaxID=3119530 RepID=A0ABP9U604_9BACT